MPSFIITQFGWTPENVDDLVVVDGDEARITIPEEFSPALVLNALSAGIASIVDSKEVMAHEVDGDMGYGWPKNNRGDRGGSSSRRGRPTSWCRSRRSTAMPASRGPRC